MNVKGSGFWYANMLKIVNSSVAEGNTELAESGEI